MVALKILAWKDSLLKEMCLIRFQVLSILQKKHSRRMSSMCLTGSVVKKYV